MTKALVKTQIRLQELVNKGEAGQGTLEYVGMIIVAAVFAAAVIAGASHAGLGDKITKAITDITGKSPS
jgi:hypothetical protein